jgi:hypothetical protein
MTAICPRKKGLIETRTFGPDTEQEFRHWLELYNVQKMWNIYCHVNLARDGTDPEQKMGIADTGWLAALHVDLDPDEEEERKPGGWERERARIRAQFNDDAVLPEGVPGLPTYLDDSGNGFYPYWELEEPIRVRDEAHGKELGLYNKRLAQIFHGGDKCHAVNWILGAPGTINYPNIKKMSKGRKPTQRLTVFHHEERRYTLDQFQPAEPDKPEGQEKEKEFVTKIDFDKVKVHADLDVLDQWRVNDRVKEIIEHGKVPGEVKPGDDSGSVWQLEASCALVRRRVPDQLHYELLMDPKWKWHETIRGHGGSKYAVRQINRAKEKVAEDVGHAKEGVVHQMNAEGFGATNMQGKFRVAFCRPHPRFPMQMDYHFATEKDFINFERKHKVEQVTMNPAGGMSVRMVGRGEVYLDSNARQEFDGLRFLPGKERILDGRFLNTWSDFAVKPSSEGSCSRYLDLLFDIICAGKQARFDYLQGWMASIFQKPWDLQQTAAMLLKSPGKGAGKGVAVRQLGLLLGRHFLPIAHEDHLIGKFNAHQGEAVLVFVDETCELHDKKALGVLNTLITEPTKMYERKGIDAVPIDNFARIIIATNEDDPLTLQFGDRRWCVWNVSEAKLQNRPYFRAIVEQMDNGGREALLHHLLSYNLANYDPAAIPDTEEKHRMILRGAPPFEQVLIFWAQEGRLPGALVGRFSKRGEPLQDRPHIAASSDLYEALRKSGGKALMHESDPALSAKLKVYGFEPHGLGHGAGKKAPPLHLLQAQLERKYEALKGTWEFKGWGAKRDVQLELVG